MSRMPASGAISMSNIVSTFGGTGTASLSEYYRGGVNVPDGTLVNANIPKANTIKLSNYYNTGKAVTVTYELIGGGGGGGYGVDDGAGSGSAGAGGSTTITYGGSTITGGGGAGGANGSLDRGSAARTGDSSHYGAGGTGGGNNSNASNATASHYGAGGGGGGGDADGTYDRSGNAGEGGFAGTRKTGTISVQYGTSIAATVGSGAGGASNATAGGSGASGWLQLKWDSTTYSKTAGTYTVTVV
jgi:hypothetical protein